MGNELVNIGSAVIAAGFWDDLLGHQLSFWPLAALSTGTVLPLVLLFGEVIPKTLSVKRPERVAPLIARPLRLFATLVTPIRWVLRRISGLLTRPFTKGRPAAQQPALSEAEFRSMLVLGEREGVIEEQEHEWIRNVLEFDDRTVQRVMTARQQVFALPITTPSRSWWIACGRRDTRGSPSMRASSTT